MVWCLLVQGSVAFQISQGSIHVFHVISIGSFQIWDCDVKCCDNFHLFSNCVNHKPDRNPIYNVNKTTTEEKFWIFICENNISSILFYFWLQDEVFAFLYCSVKLWAQCDCKFRSRPSHCLSYASSVFISIISYLEFKGVDKTTKSSSAAASAERNVEAKVLLKYSIELHIGPRKF